MTSTAKIIHACPKQAEVWTKSDEGLWWDESDRTWCIRVYDYQDGLDIFPIFYCPCCGELLPIPEAP